MQFYHYKMETVKQLWSNYYCGCFHLQTNTRDLSSELTMRQRLYIRSQVGDAEAIRRSLWGKSWGKPDVWKNRSPRVKSAGWKAAPVARQTYDRIKKKDSSPKSCFLYSNLPAQWSYFSFVYPESCQDTDYGVILSDVEQLWAFFY